MLKNRAQQIKKNSHMGPKNDTILRGFPLGAPLVVQTAFVIKKWAPSAPKSAPKDRESQKWFPRIPRLWKRAPNVKPFRSLARRTALTTRSGFHYLKQQNLGILWFPDFWTRRSRYLYILLYQNASKESRNNMESFWGNITFAHLTSIFLDLLEHLCTDFLNFGKFAILLLGHIAT